MTEMMSDQAEEVLRKLDQHLRVVHFDMRGQHKYTIGHKGHAVVNEIKAYLCGMEKEDE